MGIESTGLDHEVRAFSIDGIRIEQRAAGEDGGDVLRLAGYAAVFNSPANIGGFDEVIRPGAFARAINEGQDVALVFNHDPSTVMARTTNGTLRLREDDHGLWFEADLDPADVDAQRVVAKVKRGNVRQGSFSFQVRDQRWHNDSDRPRPLREILDVDLYDVSPVTYPAYAETEVYARGRVVAPPPPAGQQVAPALPGPQFRRRQRLELHRRFADSLRSEANMDIHTLRQEYRDKLGAMESLIEAAEAAGRDLTEEEQRQYDALDGELRSLRARIERLEELRAARDAAPEPAQPDTRNAPRIEVRDYDERDFRSFGEFIHAVRFNPGDQRLRGQRVEDRADLQMSVDALGGYLVPEQFRSDLLRISPREAVVRPRAFVIPAGSPPDAVIRIPILDQSGTRGVYAGVQVAWINEGAQKPETNPQFDEVSLEPQEVAAHTVLTDKLIRNAPIADSVVRQLLRQAIIAAEDVAFLTGDGNGKPVGLIGHASNVTVNRETADQITYGDVVAMYSRFLFGGNPVWLASQTVLPQLMQMTDAAGQLVWQPNARDDVPGTLLGIPVVVSNRMPTLGTKGDLVLADLGYYLIKDGAPLAISASEHVFFRENKTVIKAFWMTTGRPWLSSPIQDEDGTTVSPFVVLDVPAA